MESNGRLKHFRRLEEALQSILRAARIPGAAIAVVADGRTVYAKGLGYRDLKRRKPVTPDTAYPIASTTKGMNATLLGMLADERLLEWDAPVQRYLPGFRLKDSILSSRVTVRDLVTMQTGLPRHDWAWIGSSMTRATLVARLAHLELSADFRRRFQYSNLSVTAAGHIAEVITGKSWEVLVQERIFAPLGMDRTSCMRPLRGNVSLSYHENAYRKLILSGRLAAETTAPSGGVVYSTVVDMTRWILFNLNGGVLNGARLIRANTLAYIHEPQIMIGDQPLASLPADAAYAHGWVVHPYNGYKRIWHGGYLDDIHSSVMLFPNEGIGMVSFINFGCPAIADLLNQYAFDAMMGLKPAQTVEQRLAQYEEQLARASKVTQRRKRAQNTRPSHRLTSYLGTYSHAGYGEIAIKRRGRTLLIQRHGLLLRLKHWHYDVWAAEDDPGSIHQPHAFDRANLFSFDTNPEGEVVALSIKLEPTVAPIRFEKL